MARRPSASTEGCCSTELVLLLSFPDRDFFFVLDGQAPARRSSEFLLDFLQVIVTATFQPSRHAAYDATLAERRVERWTSAYQSRGGKLYLNLASSPSISKNAPPRDVRYQSIDETLHLHSYIIQRVDTFQTKAEAPPAAKIIAC
jgi:hypothetical protein